MEFRRFAAQAVDELPAKQRTIKASRRVPETVGPRLKADFVDQAGVVGSMCRSDEQGRQDGKSLPVMKRNAAAS